MKNDGRTPFSHVTRELGVPALVPADAETAQLSDTSAGFRLPPTDMPHAGH